jgi:hypothetical protein
LPLQLKSLSLPTSQASPTAPGGGLPLYLPTLLRPFGPT